MHSYAAAALMDDCHEAFYCCCIMGCFCTEPVDHWQVRLEAMELLWQLSNIIGHETLSVGTAKRRRLVDDVFVCMSNAAMDIVVPIRVRACELLGCLKGVRDDYVIQAFSKKPMSTRTH